MSDAIPGHDLVQAVQENPALKARIAELEGYVSALREVLVLAKDEPRASMEAQNQFWRMLFDCLDKTAETARAHDEQVWNEAVDACATRATDFRDGAKFCGALDDDERFQVEAKAANIIAQCIRALKKGGA